MNEQQPANPSMNPALAKMANAKVYLDRVKLNYGSYLVRVLAHRLKLDGFYGNTAIAELKVLKAEDLRSFPENCPAVRAHRVGETISYTENISSDKKGGNGRFQAHLMRLFGFDAQLNVGQLGFVYGMAQPGYYLDINVDVTPKWLEPKGNFTKGTFVKKYNWSSVEPSDADVAAIEEARKAANLPALAATMQQLASIV